MVGRWRCVRVFVLVAASLAVAVSAKEGQWADAQSATPELVPTGPVCQGTGFVPAVQIVLAVEPDASGTVAPETLDRVREILARRAARVSPEGCGVWADGTARVLVQLARSVDPDETARTLSGTAHLAIVDTTGAFPEPGTGVQSAAGTPAADATPPAPAFTTILTGADITDAYLAQSAAGSYQVAFSLTEAATERFAAFTAGHIGQPLAIVLNGEVVSVPIVQAEITGGQIVIEGNFTLEESQALVIQLQAGALPAVLTVVEVSRVTIDASGETASPLDGGATPGATPVASGSEVDGVEMFTIESANHTSDPVAYEQSPPVGGMHDPRWQNCGFYDAPVRNENAVHTLEHGVVWITYTPDLPLAEVDALRQLALVNDRLLVSPYPGLDASIVLSTWDRQLRLATVDDPRLIEFITAYTGQSPEPNATCLGGVPGAAA